MRKKVSGSGVLGTLRSCHATQALPAHRASIDSEPSLPPSTQSNDQAHSNSIGRDRSGQSIAKGGLDWT